MKLEHSIPLIFAILLGLVVLSKLHTVAAAISFAAVPILVIWQVVIALRYKGPDLPTDTFEDKWYENP